MQHLDTDFMESVVTRLEKISPLDRPQWGEMRRKDLIEHLIWALRHSMGRSTQVPFFGNWFTVHLVGPLFFKGILRIPKNLKLPARLSRQGISAREPGDVEDLHALMEEYLNLVQADELAPAPHPAFGAIGVDGWDRMHVCHFEHHLKQFGV